jgi:hypothetical protein
MAFFKGLGDKRSPSKKVGGEGLCQWMIVSFVTHTRCRNAKFWTCGKGRCFPVHAVKLCRGNWIEWNGIWVRALPGPMHLGFRTGPLCPILWWSPVPLLKFQMAPHTYSQYSQGPKRSPDVWSQALTRTQNVDWGSVFSITFLQVGLLLSPIIYKCLLKVLCPLSRPITTLDCVLLKDNNRALLARSGPQINSRACVCRGNRGIAPVFRNLVTRWNCVCM